MKKMRYFFLFLLLFAKAFSEQPPRPWAKAFEENFPPAQPDTDYTPIVVPNGCKAEYHIVNGVKVFHLIAEPIEWEVAKGLIIHTWGYNGSVPGPLIEGAVGDKVRIYVTNKLPAPTTIHWHGMLIPCGMDGVSGVTQPAIPPGQTFRYEFILSSPGTFMYHSHHDTMIQEGMGLNGMIVVHGREPKENRPDRDFAILLHEWRIDVGTSQPNPSEMIDFNVLTMNGKVMPFTESLVAKLGDIVWIRYGNLSPTDHHPIHHHGYSFKIIGSDGGWASEKSILLPETTVLVPVGSTRVIEFLADNPGDWLVHCHMTHHMMNQMGHNLPNMIGVDMGDLEEKIRELIPGFKSMGTTGMHDLMHSGMPLPGNSIPMLGYHGQFGHTDLGGMGILLKVREHLDTYDDPGFYQFPENTQASLAGPEELQRDGIKTSLLIRDSDSHSH